MMKTIMEAVEQSETKLLKEWLDYLRSAHRIPNSVAASRAGLDYDRVRNIKRGGSSATHDDLYALASAFPELRSRAKQAGIETNLTPEQLQLVRKLEQELENQRKKTKELEDEYNRVKAGAELDQERIELLKADQERMSKLIDTLTDLLKQKAS